MVIVDNIFGWQRPQSVLLMFANQFQLDFASLVVPLASASSVRLFVVPVIVFIWRNLQVQVPR